MSSLKVYLKRGAANYKEKRLIADIEKAVAEKMEKDSSFASTFTPARNFDELQKLHKELTVLDVEFTEIEKDKNIKVEGEVSTHEEFARGIKDTIIPPEDTNNVIGSNLDPFNESNPIVRDYVTENGFKENGNEQEKKTTFEEPKDFQESFRMPSSEDEKGSTKKAEPINIGNNVNKKDSKKTEPLNPSFDNMDNGKKKRSTKKFAKIIIDGACLLAEKGCIWWTTKDITEDKLVEYQLNDVMDLNILLNLEDNQQQAVKDWFRVKVAEAQTLFKISPEDRADLTDSLYEVMLEKGVAPTPMQELIINSVKAFVLDMGLKAYQFNASIQGVITQLTALRVSEKEANVQQSVPRYVPTTQAEENTIDDYLKTEEDNIPVNISSELAIIE